MGSTDLRDMPGTAVRGAPALDVVGVSHSYGSRLALDDVSFRVPQGSFTALLGPNGAGKSTLFSLITRLYNTQKGEISILGRSLAEKPGEALRRLGVVFQARTLDLDLSIRQNLAYHASLHGLPGKVARARTASTDGSSKPRWKLSGQTTSSSRSVASSMTMSKPARLSTALVPKASAEQSSCSTKKATVAATSVDGKLR